MASDDSRARSSAETVDTFGFELPEFTPAQLAARAACHAAASRREARAEWVSIDRDRTLPGHAELKKLARKVCFSFFFFFLFVAGREREDD